MTQVKFKEALKKAFSIHMFMNQRDKHTVNELLYVLEHDAAFNDMDFNISVQKLDKGCMCIPTLDTFVDIHTRSIWFDDGKVEFDVEEWEFAGETVRTNCITVYEVEVI